MKILVINSGSSSVKYQFVDTDIKKPLAWGIAEKIGQDNSLFTYKTNGDFIVSKKNIPFKNHESAINTIVDYLENSDGAVIKERSEIDGIGHRVVHGADAFRSSVKITDEVVNKMKELIFLAPLHNPANIKGIEITRKLFPSTPQCGVFDTAFHQTMPKYAAMYAIPKEYYDKQIKKYGFHGTSHRYVSAQAAKILGKSVEELKIISCHLGNGASIAAIKYGKSIDTSMGLTPLEGLMMGTRGGDMDPALPLFLMQNFDMNIDEVNNILNKKSGVLGVSGKCSDMRELHELREAGDADAENAFQMYAYRLKKYIGSYAAILGGVDVLVFTGGIGERDEFVRETALEGLEFMGIELDQDLNLELNKKGGKISKEKSPVPIYIIPTDEEMVIALDTEQLILN